jgi:hypothetical protein
MYGIAESNFFRVHPGLQISLRRWSACRLDARRALERLDKSGGVVPRAVEVGVHRKKFSER